MPSQILVTRLCIKIDCRSRLVAEGRHKMTKDGGRLLMIEERPYASILRPSRYVSRSVT